MAVEPLFSGCHESSRFIKLLRLLLNQSRFSTVTGIVQDSRLAASPGIVLGSGLVSTMIFVLVVYFVQGLGIEALIVAGAGGAFGALGGAAGSLWHNWSVRHASADIARAEHDARHDQLTGLLNRSALFAELDGAFQKSQSADTTMGVLFLDLDRFKVINDSMGHEAGDELLRIVANRLRSSVRGSDVVARFGGDEFVVVCRDLMNEQSVIAVAESILRNFAEPVSLYGGAQVISTSIGVAIAKPDDSRRPEDLVRDADAAMYKAKKARSGYAVFDEEQRLLVIDRLDIERDLVRALDEGQFEVYYQPIVNVDDRRLYGFEALVRWNHPSRGLLGPGAFLGVAEETGMMAAIGELVLREACAQAAVWNHLSPEAASVRMSVNVAEQQLLDATFPELIAEVIHWAGLPAEQLVLEIIEDVIVDNLEGLNMLREIRKLGVGLAIDDFGTGQSSLGYVKQLDMVSILKIDKTFVDEMGNGQTDRAIIDAVVTMAKALDLRVIAEGVENEQQLKDLKDSGVSIMQGYLFNQPVTASVVDPASWFQSRASEGPAAPKPGLTPLQVSRAFANPEARQRPARRV